jgi:hypothetical protein
MRFKLFGFILVGFALLNFSKVYSQSYAETALLFSRSTPGGSARVQALGGSQIALGGDYSSALSNPAGLGMFNRSEFTFSAGLASHNTSANYVGNNSDDNRSVFNIPGLSLVLNMPQDKGGFLGGSFGISMTRTNDFNSATTYSGFNSNSSIVDYFIDQANGSTTAQFDEGASNYNTPTGLAYFNYLIGPTSILNPPGPDNEYFTDASYPTQQEQIVTKGGANQWSISYGGNYKDKIFFGGGIGIASLNFKSQKIFTENFASDTLQNLNLIENLNIKGSGLNATFGAIARPVDFFQIGVSFTTPTFYNLHENYDASMTTRWNNFDYYGDQTTILNDNSNDPAKTDIVTSDYNLTVPLKFSTGIAFISKYGFISGDLELTNPAKAKYSSTSGLSYSSDNASIRSLYTSIVNYRFGAEFRYNIFRARAGYGVQSNAYQTSVPTNNQVSSISGGLGVRTKTFYIDFALIGSQSKQYKYQPYTFSDGSGPIVNLKRKSTTGMITLGFTF